MISAPARFGLILATLVLLAVAVTFTIVPPQLVFARLAPEQYLAGLHTYVGTANISDEIKDSSHVPWAIVAWRQLRTTRDSLAFTRLAGNASPGGRLYGIAGLRALAPEASLPKFIVVRADSVYLNSSCRVRQLPFSSALRELDVPGWPDSLQQAPVECR